jgi:Lon protease-like protein
MSLVPIFPLRKTVFFPTELLPLHLFEPRYRQMAEDTIRGDRRLVVVLLRPGWEQNYDGNPPVHEIATLGHIDEDERLPDGRFNIILRGLERVRLVDPQSTSTNERLEGKLYRARDTYALPEVLPPSEVDVHAMAFRLRELESELAATTGRKTAERRESANFRWLVNTMAATSDIPASMKQCLLEEGNLLKRASKLEALLFENLKFWRLLAHYRQRSPEDPTVN